VPGGRPSTVSAAGHPLRRGCDIAEIDFIIHISASVGECLEFRDRRASDTRKGEKTANVEPGPEGYSGEIKFSDARTKVGRQKSSMGGER
jgi:hypothetical protein